MHSKLFISIAFLFSFNCVSCNNNSTPQSEKTTITDISIKEEKAAILSVLNNETKAAFTRDYDSWQKKWVHESYVSKTYIMVPDSSATESLGWESINQFVVQYFEDHPEPDPLPEPITDIDVRIYGSGAWVEYQQEDPARGLKRETRLMEKIDGEWKIAGMHTSIYGTKSENN